MSGRAVASAGWLAVAYLRAAVDPSASESLAVWASKWAEEAVAGWLAQADSSEQADWLEQEDS